MEVLNERSKVRNFLRIEGRFGSSKGLKEDLEALRKEGRFSKLDLRKI